MGGPAARPAENPAHSSRCYTAMRSPPRMCEDKSLVRPCHIDMTALPAPDIGSLGRGCGHLFSHVGAFLHAAAGKDRNRRWMP